MMKSMTGFGRCEVSEGQRKFTVELDEIHVTGKASLSGEIFIQGSKNAEDNVNLR